MANVNGCRILLIGLAGALASGAAGEPPAAPPKPLGALLACRAETADAARLACFDRASAELAGAAERRDVVVMDKAEVRRTRRSLFGLALPRLPFLGGDDAPGKPGKERPAEDDVDQIETSLAVIGGAPGGYLRLTLTEGGTWQTTEPLGGSDPRVGQSVLVKRGSLGSFRLRVGNGRWVSARRVL